MRLLHLLPFLATPVTFAAPHLPMACTMDAKTGAYSVRKGEMILTSAPLSVFAMNKWFSASLKSLLLESTESSVGTDALGAFIGSTAVWSGQMGHDGLLTTVRTTVVAYSELNACRFTLEVPDGLSGTSFGYDKKGNSAPSIEFPALRNASSWKPSVLSWEGSFMNPIEGRTFSTTGGPYVLYDGADPAAGETLLLSAIDHAMTTSRADTLHDGSDVLWAASPASTVTSIPAGYTQSFIAVAGTGVTTTVNAWGAALRTWYSEVAPKVADVTLEKLGYQTDNGAMYCFGGMKLGAQVFYDLKHSFASHYAEGEIPIGYLSFQGDGMMMPLKNSSEHGKETAPWCVSQWESVHTLYGNVSAMQEELGWPLQLYAPYFCNDTAYATDFGGNWTMVRSDPTLPNCDDYLFYDAAPEVSQAFYGWLFDTGLKIGMHAGWVRLEGCAALYGFLACAYSHSPTPPIAVVFSDPRLFLLSPRRSPTS